MIYPSLRKVIRVFLALILLINHVNRAHALEFFIVSPEPEYYKKLDINIYQSSYQTQPYTSATLPSIQLYYGLLPNMDIDLLLNHAIYHPHDTETANANGIGDTLVTLTYSFLNETKYLPKIAIIPSFLIPTGNYDEGLGNGRPAIYFPVSAQKKWMSWKLIINMGYAYNMAPFTRNYFYGGPRLGYQFNDAFHFGLELYHQGATSNSQNSDTNGYLLAVEQYDLLNVGADYQLTKHFSIQASAGKSVNGSKVICTFLGFNYSI